MTPQIQKIREVCERLVADASEEDYCRECSGCNGEGCSECGFNGSIAFVSERALTANLARSLIIAVERIEKLGSSVVELYPNDLERYCDKALTQISALLSEGE